MMIDAASQSLITANETIALSALELIGDAGLLEDELIDGRTFGRLRSDDLIRQTGQVWVITLAGRAALHAVSS